MLIVPNLEPYLQLLVPEMLLEKQKNETKRHEAWRVYGALLVTSSCNMTLFFIYIFLECSVFIFCFSWMFDGPNKALNLLVCGWPMHV